MPPSLDVGPLPPPELRERVTGTRDEAWFVESGARTVDEWRRALGSAGLDLAQFPVLVDFGCGCGRALRHLARLAPAQTVMGLDTDPAAIAWVRQNLAGVTADHLAELPPSPLADASVDLVLSHSVFTHLPEDVQFAWLADIRRMLRPGGVLVASVHGDKAYNEYLAAVTPTSASETVAEITEAMADKGFYHLFGRTEAERSYPQYYGAAFHTIGYVAREWLKEFDLVAWYKTFALQHQDVLVLRRKPSAGPTASRSALPSPSHGAGTRV